MEEVKNSFVPGKVQRQTNPELLINWGFGRKRGLGGTEKYVCN